MPASRRSRPRRPARASALAALAVGVLALPIASRAAPPTVRLETDVSEQSYDVVGRNADEVFASIQRHGLGGEAGLSASGLTTSDLSFSLLSFPSAAGCDGAELTFDARVRVTLPRHAQIASLDGPTRRQWEAYAALVEFHEYRHVEIEFQGVEELQSRLERGEARAAASGSSRETCAVIVEKAIREQAEVTRRRHAQFHMQESRVVREEQAKLLAQIDALDDSLAASKREIDRLEAEIDALDAERAGATREIDVLVQQHGRELPPYEFARAQDLGAVVEALTAEIDEIVDVRNARVTHYNGWIDDRRDLAMRLAWTR
ncbi:MAG: DUF922 domain-containing protein [Deltaproteobacteria bacterium]|nr:DUF922 domain-containing protein [Deltaproteobacteria bacterium]